MNAFDWIIIAALAACLAGAVAAVIKRKRRGGCSCGCESCPHNCKKR
ncbi:MAG: FeoB-associated Cys-rich membrane protein [Clostridia bacterium]|nr:FeoB-associated Cys-rich membrane protein [Clostridia bacterium]